MNQRFVKTSACLIAVIAHLVFFSGQAFSEKLYQYRDEDGVLHFSNTAPATGLKVKVRQVRVDEYPQKVHVEIIKGKHHHLVEVQNDHHGPIQIQFTLVEKTNVLTRPEAPARFVIPAAGAVNTLDIFPADTNKTWRYRFEYTYTVGDPAAEHRLDAVYGLPFGPGHEFRISQGFKGAFSHQDPDSLHAVDISMPEGTPVRAARSGVVMDVASDFFNGGSDKDKYENGANFIRILHDDGTMAIYAHLLLESAQVYPGKQVMAGDMIGLSGDTGFSTGPHLHFAVQKNAGMKLVSMAFRFVGEDGVSFRPEQGMMLSTMPLLRPNAQADMGTPNIGHPAASEF